MTKFKNKWLSLLILCFGGGIIYVVPYIQYSYYDILQQAFNIDNLQMGNLMSILGIISAVAYLFGGILADKFSVKWLVSISLAGTGLASLWFATFPTYGELLIIMAIFGVTTILTYWPAMIKAVKLLGSDNDQGKLFGFREAGFGLFALAFTQVGTWLVFNASPDVTGVRNIIVFYAIIYFVAAILSFIFIPNSSKKEDGEKVSIKELANGVKYVFKIPVVWVIGLVVFTAYCISGPGIGKLVPYWTSVMGMDSSVAASLSSLRLYLLPFIAAPLGGLLVDKFRSSTKFLTIAFITLAVALTAFVLTPGTSDMLVMTIILGFIASFVIYTMRGTYFVPMTEARIPNAYIGTAAGLISFIGYLPDAFMFTVFGKMMGDAPGEAEFKSIFWFCVGLAVVGLALNVLVHKMLKARQAKISA